MRVKADEPGRGDWVAEVPGDFDVELDTAVDSRGFQLAGIRFYAPREVVALILEDAARALREAK